MRDFARDDSAWADFLISKAALILASVILFAALLNLVASFRELETQEKLDFRALGFKTAVDEVGSGNSGSRGSESSNFQAGAQQGFHGKFQGGSQDECRFEAYWHPVEVFPGESELIIEEEPSANAIRQSAKLSMPLYASPPSKTALLASVNDSVLETSLNSSDEEASRILFQAFNASLDAAALEGSEVVTGLLFPSDYSGPGFGEENEESFQTLL